MNSTCNVYSPDRYVFFPSGSCLKEAHQEQILQTHDFKFTVFPNPAREEFGVKIKAKEMGEMVLNLLDINGRLIQTRSEQTIPGENILVMDVRNLKSGLYILQILNQEGLKATERVIVE
jgi:hypothetical protein